MKDRHCSLVRLGWLLALLLSLLTFPISKVLALSRDDVCRSQTDCKAGRFCAQPPLSRLPGTCGDCWRCCLFPQAYGIVACSRCNCRAGRSCNDDGDCGPAEFCAVLRRRTEVPTCQPCTLCRNDSLSLRGSCAAACLSGSLDVNGVSPLVGAHYAFVVYDIGGHEQARAGLAAGPGAPVNVTEDAVRLWLEDYPPHVVTALLSSRLLLPSPPPHMQPQQRQLQQQEAAAVVLATREAPRAVAVGVLAARLAALLPQPETLCPTPPSDLARIAVGFGGSSSSYAPPADVVPEGCPCNATADAASFRCPAGHRCSSRAWLSLPGDVVSLGNAALLKARCEACDPGSYCPEGTFLEEKEGERVPVRLDCPAGQYCPIPRQTSLCPAGFFCPIRTTEPLTCDYEKLLGKNQDLMKSWSYDREVSLDLVRRLLKDGEPLRGNYCPNGSVVPSRRCSPGFFCPTPAEQLPCTEGHYCRAENIAATLCPPLTLCRTGAAAPTIWPAALLAFLGLAVMAILLAVLMKLLDRSKRHYVTDQERRSSAERQLREFTAAFLNRRPWLTAMYPELAALKRYNLTVEDLTWRANGRLSGQPILNGITGRFEAGQLAAVLGPSGCGKSSLLALLAGRAPRWPASSGQIWLYDMGTGVRREVTDPRGIREIVGFVPQDDIVCPDLTIRENLEYSAALRLPLRRDSRRLLSLPTGSSASAPTPAPASAPALASAPTLASASTFASAEPSPANSQPHPYELSLATSGLRQCSQGQGRTSVQLCSEAPTPSANTLGTRPGPANGTNPHVNGTNLHIDGSSNGTGAASGNGTGVGVGKGRGVADVAEGSGAAGGGGGGGGEVAAGAGAGVGATGVRARLVNAGRALKSSISDAGKNGGGGGGRGGGGSADGGGTAIGGGSGGGGEVLQGAAVTPPPAAAGAAGAAAKRQLTSHVERRKVVDQVLRMMALRNLQQYRVGSVESRIISGGQRKRLNIGLELVSRPSLLFLDEPTSGLDASCSASVLRALHSLASSGGVNVVAVVHQPRHSVFTMFHQVQLLGEAGYTVYHGSPLDVQNYFESLGYTFPPYENVADTLLDIVTGKIINQKTSVTTAKLPRCWQERREALSQTRGSLGRTAAWLPCPAQTPAAGLVKPVSTAAAASTMVPGFHSHTSDCDTDAAGHSGSHASAAATSAAGAPGATAATAGTAAASTAAGGAAGPTHGSMGFSKPEFTEDTKEVLEAEFDRLLQMPTPRLSYSSSYSSWSPSFRRTGSVSVRGSFRAPPPEGLARAQLMVLFKTLGQEEADAEALVRVIMAAHEASQEPVGNGPDGRGGGGGEQVYISKEQLISTLLDIASGVVRVPDQPEEEEEGEEELAEPQSVSTNMAAVASATLEVFASFNTAVLRRMGRFRYMTGSLPRYQTSQDPAGELPDAAGIVTDGIGSRAVSGAPLERSSLSNVPLILSRLLMRGSMMRGSTGNASALGSPLGSLTRRDEEQWLQGRPSGGGAEAYPAGPSGDGGALDADAMAGATGGHHRSRISSCDIDRAIAAAAALMPNNPTPSLAAPGEAAPGSRGFMGLLRSSVKKFNRPKAHSAAATIAASMPDRDPPGSPVMSPFWHGEPLKHSSRLRRTASRSAMATTAGPFPESGSRRMASYRVFPPVLHRLARTGAASPYVSGNLARLTHFTADDTIAEAEAEGNEASSGSGGGGGSGSRAATLRQTSAVRDAAGIGEVGGVEAALADDPYELPTAASRGSKARVSSASAGLPWLDYPAPCGVQRCSTSVRRSRFAQEPFVGILLDGPEEELPYSGLTSAAASAPVVPTGALARAPEALVAAVAPAPARTVSGTGTRVQRPAALGSAESADAAAAAPVVDVTGGDATGGGGEGESVGGGVSGEFGDSGRDSGGGGGSEDAAVVVAGAFLSPFASPLALPEDVKGVDTDTSDGAAAAKVDQLVEASSSIGTVRSGGGRGGGVKGRKKSPANLKVAGLDKPGGFQRLGKAAAARRQQEQQQRDLQRQELERDASQFSSPGWFSQLRTFSRRAAVQSSRAFWPAGVLEVGLLLAAAAAVGANQGRNWGPTAVPGNAVMAMMCLAVLAVVQHLGTFSTNRHMTQRERGAGLSSTAFFTAKCLVDIPWILAAPIIFTLPYFVLTVPRARLVLYYVVSVGVWWWASGLAYLVTLLPLVPPAAAPTVAVLITLIAGALLHGGGTPTLAEARGTPAAALLGVSYNRWALEALSIAELDNYMDTHRNVIASMYSDKGTCRMDLVLRGNLYEIGTTDEQILAYFRLSVFFGAGYCRTAWKTALIVLFSLGMVLRVLAMLALRYDSTIIWLAQATLRRCRELKRWLRYGREKNVDLATVTMPGTPPPPLGLSRTAHGQKGYGRNFTAGAATMGRHAVGPSTSGGDAEGDGGGSGVGVGGSSSSSCRRGPGGGVGRCFSAALGSDITTTTSFEATAGPVDDGSSVLEPRGTTVQEPRPAVQDLLPLGASASGASALHRLSPVRGVGLTCSLNASGVPECTEAVRHPQASSPGSSIKQ